MTLVVCRKDNEDVFIHSDSKVLDEFGPSNERSLRQNSMLGGLLKTVILHPHICLSFAGSSPHATDFLRDFFKEDIGNWNTPRLIEKLLSIHQASSHQCEFILCEVVERSPRISVIKNGSISINQVSAWIGSQPAYNSFQAAFHSSDASIPLNERMRGAFRVVLEDETISEVGHFHIEAYLEHNITNTGNAGGGPDSVFLYDFKSEWDTGNQVFHLPGNARTALSMGDAAHGAYGISYFRSLSTKRHGVAMHFPHANLGLLMCPQIDCEKAIVFPHCTAVELLQQVWETYQISMEGFAPVSDTLFRHVRSGA